MHASIDVCRETERELLRYSAMLRHTIHTADCQLPIAAGAPWGGAARRGAPWGGGGHPPRGAVGGGRPAGGPGGGGATRGGAGGGKGGRRGGPQKGFPCK